MTTRISTYSAILATCLLVGATDVLAQESTAETPNDGASAQQAPAAVEGQRQEIPVEESVPELAPAEPPSEPAATTGETVDAAGESEVPEQSAEDALGFGDSSVVASKASATGEEDGESEPPVESSAFRLSGSMRVQGALRLERSGDDRFGKLRQVLIPRLEYQRDLGFAHAVVRAVASGRGEADFAYLLRQHAYDEPTNEIYGSRLIAGETYLSLSSSSFELAFGEQIVTLGQGEVLSLLDVVNPRDLREPLFADLEELRLPVLMTRAGFSLESLRADLIIVHEPYFGLLAPPLGEFSPLRKLLLDNPATAQAFEGRELRNRHYPGRDPMQADTTQFHGRLAWSGSGLDLTLQAGSLLDGIGVPSLPDAQAFAARRIALPVYHPRYGLLGHSGAYGVGAFVVRWELATELNRPQIVQQKDTVLPVWTSERFNTVRGLLGLTYVPNGRTNLSLELLQTAVLDNPDRKKGATTELLFPIEATQLAFRGTHSLLRDRLTFTAVILCIGLADFNALAARVEGAYELFDGVKLALGAVTYQTTDNFGPFYGFERNDRVYSNFRWDFAAN